MSDGGVRIIEPDELPNIRSQWEKLWYKVPEASPFQSPAWLLPWAEVYAPQRCWAAAQWRSGKLAALMPAFVWESSMLLAGAGPGDHASALFAPGAEGAASDLLARLAAAIPEPLDSIDFKQLSFSSPLIMALLAGFTAANELGEPCLVLRIGGADGMANVPKRMRANWRYAVRHVQREGASLEVVGLEEAGEAAAELEELHALRWRAEGEEGVLADDLAARHLRLAIPELARVGLLRMHRLRAMGRSVAMLFAMRGRQSTCYYLSGFDPEWASFSPGTVLIGAAIAAAAHEGRAEFDFLRGQEEYKCRWGAKERPTLRRILTRRLAP